MPKNEISIFSFFLLAIIWIKVITTKEGKIQSIKVDSDQLDIVAVLQFDRLTVTAISCIKMLAGLLVDF